MSCGHGCGYGHHPSYNRDWCFDEDWQDDPRRRPDPCHRLWRTDIGAARHTRRGLANGGRYR
jgi:hypothetical protein